MRDTHYVFTAGKDRLVKYWDADKFEALLELPGHSGAVWCLALSRRGDFVISGGQDRSLRRWERTQEPFFVEEERERRLESMFEQVQCSRFPTHSRVMGGSGGQANGQQSRHGRRTRRNAKHCCASGHVHADGGMCMLRVAMQLGLALQMGDEGRLGVAEGRGWLESQRLSGSHACTQLAIVLRAWDWV